VLPLTSEFTAFTDPIMSRLTRGFRRAAAALLGGAAVLCALSAAPAIAADDEEETFEERLIKYVLGGVGVDVGNRPDIDYRERSPLVLPN